MDDELAAFCSAQYPRLVGSLSLYCGDRDVAEELAQEALLRAMQRWPSVRRKRSPAAWTHRVALNLVHSRYRRRQAERRAIARSSGDRAEHEPPDQAAGLAVRGAVAALPRRQRACLVWRYYLGWSVAEVAEALGVSSAAVSSLTYRALEALRAELGTPAPASERIPHER